MLERTIANARHACGKLYTRQATAMLERTLADARQLAVFCKRHACQATAIIERIRADARHARRNCYTRQAAAV